jgi:hypothetical protein
MDISNIWFSNDFFWKRRSGTELSMNLIVTFGPYTLETDVRAVLVQVSFILLQHPLPVPDLSVSLVGETFLTLIRTRQIFRAWLNFSAKTI